MNTRKFVAALIEKKPKPVNNETSDTKTSHVDIAQIVRDTTKQIAVYGAIAVAGYVALDTARQCAVKATPEH